MKNKIDQLKKYKLLGSRNIKGGVSSSGILGEVNSIRIRSAIGSTNGNGRPGQTALVNIRGVS